MSILDRPYFRDETAAYAKLESILWPDGPVCPKCGVVNDAHKIAANPDKKVRHGLYRCNACKAQFTVTVNTVFESSHIPLHKWLQAAHLLNSSKKGISAKQIERTLQITYKSAWFMMHRLREAMFDASPSMLGGEGKTVEADETYIGHSGWRFVNDKGWQMKRGHGDKHKIVALVERGGKARSFQVDKMNKAIVAKVVRENALRSSALMTDEAPYYIKLGREFAQHESVKHAGREYVRGDVHTNTIEGFFSIFKRGMKGIYQHCSEKHLHRYLAEFDFRYNEREALGVTDSVRSDRALRGAAGKRLTYRNPHLG